MADHAYKCGFIIVAGRAHREHAPVGKWQPRIEKPK